MTTSTHDLPFDVWHEDGLIFDSSPELFVDLDASPIIFSVRGIGYFSPRFKHVGVNISDLRTREHFDLALTRWLEVEYVLLQSKVESRASASKAPNEHQVLRAVLEGDLDLAEQTMLRLEHRRRTGMRLVGDPGR